MQTFQHKRFTFSTVDKYLAEQARLRGLVDSTELCEVDDLGNTDTIGNVAMVALGDLAEHCRNAVWQPQARTILVAASLL